MSKRAGIAVGVSIGLLALGQAAALFGLGSRVGVPLDPLGDPIIDNMRRHMAYNRGAFHLLGTLLAVPWLVALPSLAPLGRLPRLLFVPLGDLDGVVVRVGGAGAADAGSVGGRVRRRRRAVGGDRRPWRRSSCSLCGLRARPRIGRPPDAAWRWWCSS